MKDWLLLQSGIFLYVGIFLALMGGAIGLPIPEDLPLIIGGILISQGQANYQLVFIVSYAAIILGDIVIYSIGRYFGPKLFNKDWIKGRISQSRIKKVRLNLERRSLMMIFVARHLFYLRTVTFLTCGAVKMRFGRFLLADAVAALISVPLMLGLGYFAAEHYDAVIEFLGKVKTASIFVSLLLIAGIVVYYRRRKLMAASKLGRNSHSETISDHNQSDSVSEPHQDGQ